VLLDQRFILRWCSLLTKDLRPHTPRAPPTGRHEVHSRMPSPNPQCGLVGQTPMNPPAPWTGYRAGPVFHGLNENPTFPPESEVLHAHLLMRSTRDCFKHLDKSDMIIIMFFFFWLHVKNVKSISIKVFFFLVIHKTKYSTCELRNNAIIIKYYLIV